MKTTLFSFVFVLFCVFLSTTVAQETPKPAQPKLPSLATVKWAGAPVSYEQLQDKTIVIMIYATWCPKCNAWSGELFKQIAEAVQGKPIVVLAINTDDNASGIKQYVGQRKFFAPNIIHGHDAFFHKRLGLESNLFKYLTIDPEGNPSAIGRAGMYRSVGNVKEYSLPGRLKQLTNPGTFSIITDEMPIEVKNALWLCELRGLSETTLRVAKGTLGKEQCKIIDTTVNKRLDDILAEIRENYKGSTEEKFSAYDTATKLATLFRKSPQGTKGKEVKFFLEKDESFKSEIKARDIYTKAMRQTNPRSQGSQLRALVKRFGETLYGVKAQQALDQAAAIK